jgi:hypothetical protein
MTNRRVSTIVLVIAAIVIAAATASLTGAKAARPSDDFAVRHPEGVPKGAAFYAGQDFAQRHVALSAAPSQINPSDDFAIRHPEGMPRAAVMPAWYYTSADFAQRHPELSVAGSLLDTSDYFLRHTDLSVTPSDDYALRHPGLGGQ